MTQCAACGESFEAKRADARYCSQRCRQRAYDSRQRDPSERLTDNLTDNRGDGNASWLMTHFDDDLAVLHDIEQRLALGQIDASDYERADAILQAHEQIMIRANQLSIRLEKLRV